MKPKMAIMAIFPISLITFHIYYNLSHSNQTGLSYLWRILGFSFLISIPVALALLFVSRRIKGIRPEIRYFGVLFVVLISLCFETYQYINWHNKLTYAIDYANKCIKDELNNDAVIMGPYAQTVTLGTPNKSEIFYYGAYSKNDSLFEKIPATHVIYEVGMGGSKSGNETKFAEYYGDINRGSKLVDSYLIGRYYVNLYDITSGTSNSLAKNYKMTNFEKGMQFYNSNTLDSAITYFALAENSQRMKRASLYLGNIYYRQGKYALAKSAYAKGLEEDCYDPKYWALYSISCKQNGDLETAEMAKNRALNYAPFPGFFQNANF
jgi:tetratricopeptide (TPR) repeat protein